MKGGAHEVLEEAEKVLRRQGVQHVRSAPHHPLTPGKIERFWRTIREEFLSDALFASLADASQRIDMTMRDLNDDRPRPLLGGRTARKMMDRRTVLPKRSRFRMDVLTRQAELEAETGSRKEHRAARRKAVVEVMMRYNLFNWGGGVSTDYQRQCGKKLLGATRVPRED